MSATWAVVSVPLDMVPPERDPGGTVAADEGTDVVFTVAMVRAAAVTVARALTNVA
jgi:hypothetical protein